MEEAKRKRYDRQLRIWGEHGCVRGTRPPLFSNRRCHFSRARSRISGCPTSTTTPVTS